MTQLNTAQDDAKFDAQVKKFAKLPRAVQRSRIEAKLFSDDKRPRLDLSRFDTSPLIVKLQELQKLLANDYLALGKRELVTALRADPKKFAAANERAKSIAATYFDAKKLLEAAQPVLVEAVRRLDEAQENSEFLGDLGF